MPSAVLVFTFQWISNAFSASIFFKKFPDSFIECGVSLAPNQNQMLPIPVNES